MRNWLCALVCCVTGASANACFWIEGTTLDGRHIHKEGVSRSYELRQVVKQRPESVLIRLWDKKAREWTDSKGTQEFLAVADALNGKHESAIAALLRREKEAPGSYSVAANLGTIYELSGDLDHAYYWIAEGLKRNPKGHYNSEWLHLKILEAKLALAKNPSSDFRLIAFVDAPKAPIPAISLNGLEMKGEQLSDAIFLQLLERLLFVKPKDPVVAELLFAFALIEARQGTVEEASALLKLAGEYGYPEGKIATVHDSFQRAIWFGIFLKLLPYILVLCFCVGLIRLAFHKGWISRGGWLSR